MELTLPDFKLTGIKTEWYWQEDRQTDEREQSGAQKRLPSADLPQGVKTIHLVGAVLGKLGVHMRKNEVESLPHTIYKK